MATEGPPPGPVAANGSGASASSSASGAPSNGASSSGEVSNGGLSSGGVSSGALSSGTAPSSLPLVRDPEIAGLLPLISTDHIATTIQTLAGFGTRSSCSSDSGGTQGIGAARDWIKAQFDAVGGLQTMLHSFTMTQCGGTITRENVIASLPGTTHPQRLVVVGGHYDSRTVNLADGTSPAPGANDSGSQTAVVLELARVLAGHSFDATLVFAAFAGEEQGLVGSAALAQNVATVFPGSSVVAMLNCDIVGGDNTANDAGTLTQFRLYSPGTPREIQIDGGTTDDTSPSRGLMRFVDAWGRAYMPTLGAIAELREDRPGRSGDHESFIVAGYPGVRFIDPAENLAHEHTANDLFQYITPSYTTQIAEVVAAVAASLARAPGAPVSFVAQGSTAAGATLTWSPPATGGVDHYVVAARPTTENQYRERVAVGDVASVTLRAEDLGVSDAAAFFVSVTAVDAAGHESLFAYPEYRCAASGCALQPGSDNVTAKD
jgi:Zn-dependent M28 family amino/carboxypeptidase